MKNSYTKQKNDSATTYEDRIELVNSLVGILPEGASIEEGIEEKLNKHESSN